MSTTMIDRPKSDLVAPAVTAEQTALIKATIAKDATDAELQLFFYDCARQGVHPLDRLIHFTKRKGKYTPVTSIDLMRSRAADTGEYAGSDDAAFVGVQKHDDWAATVTVWRLVQGQRCSFTATARWSEYRPEEAFMWHRMPHTMLAKCAEALALRKGFPRQLAGVYSEEEMAQADRLDAAPAPERPKIAAALVPDPVDEPPAPDGFVRVMLIEDAPTSNPNVIRFTITLSDGLIVTTVNNWLASLAQTALERRTLIQVKTKPSRYGNGTDLAGITEYAPPPAPTPDAPPAPTPAEPAPATPASLPLTADDIPF